MTDPPYTLDEPARQIVLDSITSTCRHRGWNLLAAHIRTTHVHVVVESDAPSERIANDFKSYSTRALNRKQKTWARHGSALFLRTPSAVNHAIDYVLTQ